MAFGLKDFSPTVFTDSFVSAQAIKLNTQSSLPVLNQLDLLQGTYDFVLIQIPKSLNYFEDILMKLTQHLHANSQILCGFMVKYFTASSYQLLEKYVGKITSLKAVKKARVVQCSFEQKPVEAYYPREVKLDGQESSYLHHSNLFSSDKLDIGTRFFLDHLPKSEFQDILDLGCANGIVGITAQKLNPAARLHFSDDSQMSLLSAKENFKRQHPNHMAEFYWTNCFEQEEQQTLDLVLCNPPFHQGHTIGDFIAFQMFKDSHRCLRGNGLIRVIGNSHLGYPEKLKKIFGNSRIIANNKKFMIVEAKKLS